MVLMFLLLLFMFLYLRQVTPIRTLFPLLLHFHTKTAESGFVLEKRNIGNYIIIDVKILCFINRKRLSLYI